MRRIAGGLARTRAFRRPGGLAVTCAALICALLWPGWAGSAEGRATVLVVTSFPPSFYEPFRTAFERKEAGYRLRIVNRKTATAMMQVAGGQFREADVFWASAPDAFEALKAERLLATLDVRVDTPERMIGGFPLDDPDGRFRGFAVSGYGILWNSAVLGQAGISPPGAIADLADPRFRGLVAMSSPSRSGTTHLMVETVLQRHGWEKGWALWLRIAGNLATITARSFTVSNGVARARFGVGLSIDFLGRGDAAGQLGFAYPQENVFLPASIARLKAGREPEGAMRFIRFVLSQEGQALLDHPNIRRQSLRRAANAGEDAFAAAEKTPEATFDAALSGRRYELVNILFDELITDRLVRLQRFWRRMDRLRALAGSDVSNARTLDAIEDGAQAPPALIAAFGREPPAIALRRLPRGAPPGGPQAALLEAIRQAAEASLADAERAQEAALAAFEPRTQPGAMGPR